MKPTRRISRRSFLRSVAGGGAGSVSLAALTGCATTGYTDSDPFDPVGGGRWGGGGITDSDTGAYADPPGRGRRGGYSDNDPTDPYGRGRGGGGYSDNDPTDPYGGGRGSCTDSDRGRYADAGGDGRNCRGGHTDRDKGPGADPPGRGRGPR